MASMWRKAMLYLGLGPDDEYDDYEAVDERVVATTQPTRTAAPPREQAAVTPRPSSAVSRPGR